MTNPTSDVVVQTRRKKIFAISSEVWMEISEVLRSRRDALKPVLFSCRTIEQNEIWILGWSEGRDDLPFEDNFHVGDIAVGFEDECIPLGVRQGQRLVKYNMGYRFE
jgi:hypothetical protein